MIALWNHAWYHVKSLLISSCMIPYFSIYGINLLSRAYYIIAQWHLSQDLISMLISLVMPYIISWFCISDHDIKNLWYHRSMISYPISRDIGIDIIYDIIYYTTSCVPVRRQQTSGQPPSPTCLPRCPTESAPVDSPALKHLRPLRLLWERERQRGASRLVTLYAELSFL